ncbi:LemA family protein [Geomonas sp. Red32]|uniref:LemA family protein n=1 Tax=Geomonas sp. Red32 TaxID=2912856 RepID=UPI00202CBAE4|nr:LemA family protein [Geomonas sp. Red32]MCM0080866.1 LemA family protein [Geomonas sp. Red32]
MTGLIVVGVIAVILVFVLVSAYNRLISLKGQTQNAWKQIDVQLKRRHDLIPNLINSVKGAMEFERETMEAVISARNSAVKVAATATPETASQLAAAEGTLTTALNRFMAVVEAYPDLKATGNISQLQEELSSTENKVAFARQAYNDTATVYNVTQQQFPTVLMAGMAGAAPAQLWEITEEADRAVPTVNLSFH